jgi:hypothetical protein
MVVGTRHTDIIAQTVPVSVLTVNVATGGNAITCWYTGRCRRVCREAQRWALAQGGEITLGDIRRPREGAVQFYAALRRMIQAP